MSDKKTKPSVSGAARETSSPRAFRRELHAILGFWPHRLALYREAFEHSSLRGRQASDTTPLNNNERLEFLGDAIIEAVVSDELFHRYPTRREGFLTKTRSNIVRRDTLGQAASAMGFDRLIHTATITTTHNSFILGNAFEAFVGAIYLDRGYRHCRRFLCRRVLDRYIPIDLLAREDTNYKSRLLEWCQKRRRSLTFELLDETLENGSPLFRSAAVIDGTTIGTGTGYSKRESQQQAARQALRHLKNLPPPPQPSPVPSQEPPIPSSPEPPIPSTTEAPTQSPSSEGESSSEEGQS